MPKFIEQSLGERADILIVFDDQDGRGRLRDGFGLRRRVEHISLLIDRGEDHCHSRTLVRSALDEQLTSGLIGKSADLAEAQARPLSRSFRGSDDPRCARLEVKMLLQEGGRGTHGFSGGVFRNLT